MKLEDLMWKDVEEYLNKRKDILLPFGAVEEHGYHMPISTDGDIASAIAKRLSKETGILIAPIVWYGVCNSTRGYAGTTAVAFAQMKGYVREVVSSLAENGFRRLYILSGHLGSSHKSALKEACRGVDIESYFLDMTKVEVGDILETVPLHACEAETSLMLYLHPKKVRIEKAVDEEFEIENYALKDLPRTESGVWGSPTKATEEKGRRIFERIVREFSRVIKG